MHEKLSHLSHDQIADMLTQYYEGGEKVSILIEKFGLDIHPSGFVGIFPFHVHSDLACPYCDGENLVSKRLSREHGAWRIGHAFCPTCNHESWDHCRCPNCAALKRNEHQIIEQTKRDLINLDFSGPYRDIPLAEELTFTDAVYLLSLARHSLSEDFFSAQPFSDQSPVFAPTHDFRNEIIKHLYAKGFISISNESDISAFDFSEDLTSIPAYYPTRVIWEFLPSMAPVNRGIYLNKLENLVRNGPWPKDWGKDVLLLWRQISKYECFEYYLHMLSQRGYDLDEIGPKTHKVFETMLERFAVSQVFNLSWQAIRDTTDYIVKENLPTYRAKNSFIGSIERKADKAIANGWEVRHSRRDFDCPQSVISSTFSDVVLELGYVAFEMVPHPYSK
tara:strand:- start:1083 stop:2255 length:1173 start_codon:yes stop_codon:yes gene_type:complete